MGTTDDKIARNVAGQMRAPIVDLAHHRAARQMLKEAKADGNGFKQLIADGLDPCHAIYAHAQRLISISAEQLATTTEARQFARIVAAAEDTYMPSYPPTSPVTTSHFAMWSLFDVQFGQSHETIGTCFLRIAKPTGLAAGLQAAVASMQASRLGLYVHSGHDDRFVKLREIGLERSVSCLVPAGYRGEVDEIWLAPPAATGRFSV